MTSAALGVPAHPDPATVEQPDGTQITVRLRGDEHVHWYEDRDGYLVARCPQTRRWLYARREGDRIKGTDHLVGQADPQRLGLVRPDAQWLGRLRAARADARRTPPPPGRGRVPTTGTMKNLVVLVNYADMTVDYTTTQYTDLFNEVGYTTDGAVGSIRDYYEEVSRNAFTVASTVVEAVTLDNGYAYYGANDAFGWDIRPREMVEQALAKLETRGFDFSTMDGDGDGWVDCLTVIHAGRDEAYSGNDPDYIWSHKWAMTSPKTYDGVSLWPYHTVPAQRGRDGSPSSWGLTRIGVVCHEMGHILGLPDLYDTTYASKGVGDFCLMAGGSWNGDSGTSPAHMSAWCKVTLGWVTPTVISSAGSYALGAVVTTGEIVQLQGNLPSNEYFLIENRQPTSFDAALPGSSRGLLIWHVDENKSGNTDANHYKVDVEEASGTQHLQLNQNYGDDADYFRSGNATEFTQSTTPSNIGYCGTPLGLDVTHISATTSTMTFDVAGVAPVKVSGYVKDAEGTAVGGVTVSGTNGAGSDTTDAQGYYELSPASGWSGTVTPTKAGYTFTPTNRSYTDVTSDQADQDFTATPDDSGNGTLTVEAVDYDGNTVDGEIYVDWYYKGTGSWTGSVSPGEHTVWFGSVTGYRKPDTQTVEVGQNETVTVEGLYKWPLTVTASAEPNVVASGGSSTLSATVTDGQAPYVYDWSSGHTSAQATVSPKVTTTYTVCVTDALSRYDETTVQVVVATPVTASASASPTEVGSGQACVVSASATGGHGAYTYAWSTGQQTATATVYPTETTTYTVAVTDELGQQDQAEVTVDVLAPPTVTISANPDPLPHGDSSLLSCDVSGGKPPYELAWSTGTDAYVILVTPPATKTYSVTATDALGQQTTASHTLVVVEPLSVSASADPQTIQAGQTTRLTADASGGLEPYTYAWNTGASDASIEVSPTVPTTYSVRITDARGHYAIATAEVNVTVVGGEFVPGGACFAPALAMIGVGLVLGLHRRARRMSATSGKDRASQDEETA